MKIVCDSCSTKYSIADEKVRGKVFKIKCKKCSHIIVVKGDAEGAAPAAQPFEQKETKVFDYNGFDGKEPVPANPPPGEAVWHLVIDREQVGPLTVEEVRLRYAEGEIDNDTYAWREGFGDWLRLAAIDELALAAPTSAHQSAPDDMRRDSVDEARDPAYDAPRQGTGPTMRSDPADLFAAAAASAVDDETSGPELFAPRNSGGGANAGEGDNGGVYASAPAAAPRAAWGREPARATPSPKHDPFEHNDELPSRSSRSTGGLAAAHADGDVDVRPMTGQRNENSVLFSLNNLASMASDSNGAARASSPSSFPSTGGTEGSGLIDIRAMAAMTLGTKRSGEDRPRATGTADDLPVFSASSYSTSNAGVLLPSVTAERSNKIVYIFIGLVGILAVAAIVLVLVIVLGKKETIVAAPLATTAGDHGNPGSPSGSDPGSAAPAPPAANAGAPASAPSNNGGSPAVQPASAPAAAVQPGAPDNNPVAQPTPGRPVHPAPNPRHPDRDRHAPAASAHHDAEPEPAPAPSRPTPPPGEIPKPTAPQKCDEIACMVTPDLPCCPKKGGSAAARPSGPIPSVPAGGGDPNLPDKLDQPAIIDGMKSVTGRVMACNDQFHTAGTFKIAITVSPNGDVTGAAATPPIGGTPAGTCAERAVHGAHFRKTKNSITFRYPFTFH